MTLAVKKGCKTPTTNQIKIQQGEATVYDDFQGVEFRKEETFSVSLVYSYSQLLHTCSVCVLEFVYFKIMSLKSCGIYSWYK